MGVTGLTHTLLLFSVCGEERLGEEFSKPFCFLFLNNIVKPPMSVLSAGSSMGESLT